MKPEDEEFLMELYALTRFESPGAVDEAQRQSLLRLQYSSQQHSYKLHYPNADRRIVLGDGKPIGWFLVHRTPTELGLIDVALLPEHRGGGIGSHLVEWLLKEAQQGKKLVRAQVHANSAAVRFFQHLGFAQIGENGIYSFLEWVPDGVV